MQCKPWQFHYISVRLGHTSMFLTGNLESSTCGRVKLSGISLVLSLTSQVGPVGWVALYALLLNQRPDIYSLKSFQSMSVRKKLVVKTDLICLNLTISIKNTVNALSIHFDQYFTKSCLIHIFYVFFCSSV